MAVLLFLSILFWVAVAGFVLMFFGWVWIGLIMLVATALILVWFLWNASL